MDIKVAIKKVTSHQNLSAAEMTAVMRDIMTGNTTDAQNAAFLVGLQMKGVQVEELLGGAIVMRELVTPVQLQEREHLVDTCGTGGSGSNKFNVSTAAALVAACAGARVAKHGNRGATSKSGSADVLEAAGVKLSLTPEQVAKTLEQVGVGFLFAPSHHGAMKHVITARREIGVRTVFNLLGPLTNPAGAPNQVLGVYDPDWILPLLEVLKELGSRHVLVVSSEDGLDEISISAATRVGELKNDEITTYRISPEDFGLPLHENYRELQIDSAEQSLALLKKALTNGHQAASEIVALNAGAAIYTAGIVDSLPAGVEKAREILASGEALQKLEQLAAVSQSFAA
ncbi:MAG: anthranilate phosphoribosyltransferase [Gammaproteobacteria bacterium]|nr:anthranilate phosphoribosyltransferase [Pseudomonadales bacterium]MCP5349231.1 anthranilate phosphoribosyltransferase [Pseudomonadales bacterium]